MTFTNTCDKLSINLQESQTIPISIWIWKQRGILWEKNPLIWWLDVSGSSILHLFTSITDFLVVRLSSWLSFIVNLLKTIGSGADVYEDGKRRLETAIKEYDQAVFDLTAMIVASNFPHNFTNISSFSVLSGKRSKAKTRREILKMAVAILLARRRPIVVGAKATRERHARVG